MEATKERREQKAGDSVQLPTETSPYVQYNKDDGLEDYKMPAYGAQGHLPVSDVPHGSGTDAPTIPGTALPTQRLNLHGRQQPQRGARGGGAGVRRTDADEAATDAINRHGVP
ncbi:uncharacterized protein LOC123398480 [Hordeum vulgare subsp. vulgare]|uniref:Uncharacterized protein n=1 Tax=Hordeum vulgare subsp. vulgare TaxID=112509 RepID=A0A8I6XRD3_HORVV|nr:uncharacterized protein LOC123398480 [Hordeum vulgare subsp. vulgare]